MNLLSPFPGRRLLFLTPLLLACIGYYAYSPALRSFLVSDDWVIAERMLDGGFIQVAGVRATPGFYRPVTMLSYFLCFRWFGLTPAGHHLFSLFIHVVNSFLVFLIAKHMLQRQPGGTFLGFFAGLLFLVHPSHAEAVAWISGRTDLLATTFTLLSVLSFVRFASGGPQLHFTLAISAAVLAFFSKESTVVLPFLLVFLSLALCPAQTRMRNCKILLATLLPILAVSLFLRYASLQSLGAYDQMWHLQPLRILGRILQLGFRSFFPPLPHHWHDFLLQPGHLRLLYAAALVIVSVLALVAFRLLNHARRAAVVDQPGFLFLMLYGIALLPAVNLSIDIFDSMGERFVYMPSAFLMISIASLLGEFIVNSQARTVALSMIVCAYAWSLNATCRNWEAAGNLARLTQEQLSETSQDIVALLNCPDNLNGAYVFRNGLPEALRLNRSGSHVPTLIVIASQELRSTFNPLTIEQGDGALYRVTFQEGDLADSGRRPNMNCVDVTPLSTNAFQFKIDRCKDLDTANVLFFSSNKWQPVAKQMIDRH